MPVVYWETTNDLVISWLWGIPSQLVCSYCMFGKSDLLRYAYTVYDQGKG